VFERDLFTDPLPVTMIIQPEPLSANVCNWLSPPSAYQPATISQPQEFLDGSGEVQRLMEQLVPVGISPTKRAVIEQMVRRHLLAQAEVA